MHSCHHSFDGERWRISMHIRKFLPMNEQNTVTTYLALQRASQLLETAAVLSAETADADLKVARALNHAVALLADTSRNLVDDSLREIETRL